MKAGKSTAPVHTPLVAMTSLRLDVPDTLVETIAARVAELIDNGNGTSDLLTVNEAADYLRCAPKRVYDLTSQRRLGFVKDGSRTLIRREAIDRYLHEQTGDNQ